MATGTPLVGREAEVAQIAAAVERARDGRGSLLLLCGDAGVGKTRLAEAAIVGHGIVLRGAAGGGSTGPYGPVADALRSRLRQDPGAFDGLGALRAHLAVLLPELGEAAAETDRATIFEAVRRALAALGEEEPATLLLDDLHWSDETTLELLAALAPALGSMPVLAIAAYRSDGLPRDHRLRWLRNELRRGGVLEELSLAPLDSEGTAALLSELLEEEPSPSLARAIGDRTMGSPFFVEELVAALRTRGALRSGDRGLELAREGEVPVPDSVREAVLVRLSTLSPEASGAAEVAAVCGSQVDLRLASELSPGAGLAELIEVGLLEERGPGRAAFRHGLVQEALYAEVPWIRRRELHQRLAELAEAAGAGDLEVAAHWLGAAAPARARAALVRAARGSEKLHAHRDASRAARQALESWDRGEDEELRLETLERLGRCAELAGELAEAAKAWRELAAERQGAGQQVEFARAQRRLAAVYDLNGERDTAFAARRLAAEAFARAELREDAAQELLAMADHQRRGARYAESIELADACLDGARESGRTDLEARALGLKGVAEAKGGEYDAGLDSVRAGLGMALQDDLTQVAAELYQRLSLVLYDSADYRRAEEALDTALGLCRTDGPSETEVACVTCLIYVLRERGEWGRATELGSELIEAETAVWVAEGLLGAIHAAQGRLSAARRMLTSSRAVSAAVGHYNMYVDSTTGLARVAAAENLGDEAATHCRELLARWEASEDHHYAVSGIRWAANHLARQGDRGAAQACVEALAQMATAGGHAEALAALAQGLGELALLDGEPETAAEHLCRALELHGSLAIPFERAQVELRAGVGLAAAGQREEGVERLCAAYRSASKLGARLLASEAAVEVAALGESVAQRLGSRAEAAADGSGLTRRELEVLRHVAVGRTNREIAQELFISQRTVDMHVRNLLGKLECRSRVEASHRAGELGLLG
jgi:DNA-binding NarL/FixJ family response regulator